MQSSEISYIFPENFDIQKYALPETANEHNVSFINRDEIIENIIPDENIILKDLLRSNPNTPFGYLDKGKNTTKTINEASALLGMEARYVLKTMITEDTTNHKIYKIITLGDFGNIKKIKLQQRFIKAHNIDSQLSIEPIDEGRVYDYTGTENGFCRPVPLDDEYMDCLEGIAIQNKIRNIVGLNTNQILITFPVGYHESLLIPPKGLYKLLNENYPDKVTSFK